MSKIKTRATGRPRTGAQSGPTRRIFLTGLVLAAAIALLIWALFDSRPPANATIMLWQSPTHACCTRWASYMRTKGYRVTVNYVDNLPGVKAELGIPDAVRSCHTAKIGNYFIEGHVPAPAVAKLVDRRPALRGIALPGMPAGPPGMGGTPGFYRVIGFTAGGRRSHFADVGI